MIKLLVIFGGQSQEHEISCLSAGNILENVDTTKYIITKLGITKTGEWFEFIGSNTSIKTNLWQSEDKNLKKIEDLIAIIKAHDVAFPILHGKYGEDGTIQGLFELCGIKFVGSGVLASSVGMDKEFTKILAAAKGIPVVPYQMFLKGDEIIVDKNLIGEYPLIVKPCNSGSSYGVTKVIGPEFLMQGVQNAFLYDNKILIEKFIPAREIECSILGNFELVISEPGEILSANELYDYNAKYINSDSRTIIPAHLPKEHVSRIKEYSEKIFKTLNVKGLARVDFFISKTDGEIYFNELNTLPGFTDISMYPKMLEHIGINYAQLIDKLIELGME